MNVLWTGAEATALRKALELAQPRFAQRLGIHVQTVKKWARRGSTIQLDEFYSGLLVTLLDGAPQSREPVSSLCASRPRPSSRAPAVQAVQSLPDGMRGHGMSIAPPLRQT
jgi:transcriptional regulator with XRE-family HTH domain